MDLMTFGSYLKWAREELDMTQQELAEIIDCAFSTISRIETGKNCPSLKTFRSLNVVFEGFGVQYDEVFMEPIFSFRKAKKDLLVAIKNGRPEEIERKLMKFKSCVEEEWEEQDFDVEDRQYYVFAHLISVKKPCLSPKKFLDEAISIFEMRRKLPKYEDIEIIKLSNIEYEILFSIGHIYLGDGDLETAETIFKGLMANKTNTHSIYVKDKFFEISFALARISLMKNDFRTTRGCLEYIFDNYISKAENRMLYTSLRLQSDLCIAVGDEEGAKLIESFLIATDHLMSYMFKHYRFHNNMK